MGTSLSGLLPQDTYQGLLKFGDNSAISGTLKTLSDGAGNNLPMQASTTGINFTGTTTGLASGVSGAIQFSNGSAFASDAANLFWDVTNNRLGIGTLTPQNSVEIERTTGNSTLNIQGNAGTFISVKRFSNNSTRGRLELYKSRGTIAAPLVVQTGDEMGSVDFYGYDGSANQRVGILYVTAESVVGSTITPQMAFGLGTSGPTNTYKMVIKNDGNITIGNDLNTLGAKLGIKGSGSTSATTSLLVQNSSGTAAMTITDDGKVNANQLVFGGTNAYIGINNSTSIDSALRNVRTDFSSSVLSISTGEVGIGDTTTYPSAIFVVSSTTRGFLPPRMTTTQKNAISSPATGLQVFDSTMNATCEYNGTGWRVVSAGSQSVTVSGLLQTVSLADGNVLNITLNSSTTFTFTNPTIGTYILKLTQGTGGGFLVTWPGTVLWSGGTAPTLTTTAAKTDIITLVYDGTNYYGNYSLNY